MPGRWGRLVYTFEDLIFFRYIGSIELDFQATEYQVRLSRSIQDIPEHYQRQILGPQMFSPLRHRMRRGEGAVVIVSDNSGKLCAYGWMQSWRPFKRIFCDIAREAVMVGPAWTAPAFRGKGLHQITLLERIRNCAPELPVLTFAEEKNLASIVGIERSGFERLGKIRLHRVLWFIKFAGHFSLEVEKKVDPSS